MGDAEGVESRFLASGAAVAVIDARGALDDGLAATRSAGRVDRGERCALLVLVSRGDDRGDRRFLRCRRDAFLASPRAKANSSRRCGSPGAMPHAHRGGAIDRRGMPGGCRHYDRETGEARRWIVSRIAEERPVAVVLVALSRLDIVNAAHGRPAVDALIEAAVLRAETVARRAIWAWRRWSRGSAGRSSCW